MGLLTRPVTTPSALTTPPRFSGLVLSVRESRRPPASAAPMPALTTWALLPGRGGAPMVGPEPSRVKTTDVLVPPPIGAWALKRSEGGRVGTECASTCRTRAQPYPTTNNKHLDRDSLNDAK